MNSEFSYKTRQKAIERFEQETFDLLIIGGGITGVACARDAASRGLKVALVEKNDFASGTSSASSKLVHGGLRYLENFEFKLVFEALSERAHLIRTTPNMVRWLKFYLPVYKGDARGMNLISLGLLMYDLLALGRGPHFHDRLSREQMIKQVPGLKTEGLVGGFTYYDASMWDDVMCVETARAAQSLGAAIANYVEAETPIWEEGRIYGFECKDRESGKKFKLRAIRTIVCGGPFTDQIGEKLLQGAPSQEREKFADRAGHWKHWLKPSRGVHLVFDAKRFPVQGALLLMNPEDGRISFVIPRKDFGAGVTVVGTTDGPSPEDPSKVRAEKEDRDYLFALLGRYFPKLNLTPGDLVSTYVGVRPLMDPAFGHEPGAGAKSLQAVSREHHIDKGPGGTTVVAGGKYTTHRLMAREIVDYAMKYWEEERWSGYAPRPPGYHGSRTDDPVNPAVSKEALKALDRRKIPKELIERFGADALGVMQIDREYAIRDDVVRSQERLQNANVPESPAGFPMLESQFRHILEHEMAIHLEDFYFRRLPLYLSRKDHGLPWADALSRIWAQTLGKNEDERKEELKRLEERVKIRDDGGVA